jgi:FixJ family two-component response regulator
MSFQASPSPRRVFVVEDDAAVREALLMLLGDAGYEVTGYADGMAFLKESLPGKHDLVLLDIDLPGISGPEIASILRRRQHTTRIAVISGLRSTAFKEGVAQIEPFAAFRKPLDPQKLLTAIASG